MYVSDPIIYTYTLSPPTKQPFKSPNQIPGEAYAEFGSLADVQQAMSRNMERLPGNERHVEVRACCSGVRVYCC